VKKISRTSPSLPIAIPIVDALGLPLRFVLGPRQQNDMTSVIADKTYDPDSLYDLVVEQGDEPVIPLHSHCKYRHRYNRVAYKERWNIGGFAKLMQRRRIATRYDNLAANFLKLHRLRETRQRYAMAQIAIVTTA